jgi:VanZ like family
VSDDTVAPPAAPDTSSTALYWRIGFALAVVVHLAILYWPRAPSTGGIPIDKVVHAVIFGGVLWVGARAGVPVRPLTALLAAHAVVSELIQHYLLAGRSGDPTDTAADLVGVLIVVLLLRRRR